MLNWFQQLSQNDRSALIVGALALFCMLSYLLVLEPLFKRKADLQQQVVVQRELLQTMLQQSQEVRRLRVQKGTGQTTSPVGSQSLLGIIDSSINQSALRTADKRIEPRSNESVRVNFNAVSFDELVRWLTQLSNQYHIHLESINVERQDTPGVVKAYMTLML